MNTTFDALSEKGEKIVYVRAVDVVDLPMEVQAQVDGLEQLYAVHRADGQRLVLVADRKMAFALAREHDLTPVNVH